MEDLGLFQEPFKPAALPVHLVELIETIAFVYLGVQSKLSTLNERCQLMSACQPPI